MNASTRRRTVLERLWQLETWHERSGVNPWWVWWIEDVGERVEIIREVHPLTWRLGVGMQLDPAESSTKHHTLIVDVTAGPLTVAVLVHWWARSPESDRYDPDGED